MSRKNDAGEELPTNMDSIDSAPVLLTIEEHAVNQHLSAPVFAAVKQVERWADGKKVTVAVFTNAVSEFLGAPMGGK
jgi:hypothetical protein